VRPIKTSLFRPDNPTPTYYAGGLAAYSEKRVGGFTADASALFGTNVRRNKPALPQPSASPTPDEQQLEAVSHAARAKGNEEDQSLATADAGRELYAQFMTSLALGNAQRDAGKYSEAEQSYRSAQEMIPTDARPSYGRANVYADQQKWKEAEEAYRQAMSLEPHRSEVYLALAATLLAPLETPTSAEKLFEAEKLLWKAAAVHPTNQRIYDLLETVLARRGVPSADFEAAYRRALTLNPQSVKMNLRLSELLWRSERQAEADSYLSISESAASGPQELLAVAQTLESRKKYGRAERLVRRVLEVSSSDPRAHLMWGLIMIDREHYSAAVASLKFVAAATPKDFVPQYLLGIAYLGAGRLGESEQTFAEAATKISAEKESLALACWLAALGDAYSGAGRATDAVRLYEKALSYDADDRETSDKLSELRSRLKH
jgi:tetratricopeptide (TPR) repeat protein